MLTSLLIL